MEANNLIKIDKSDFPKLEEILTKCFANDPLYSALIPESELRMKLLPELFKCDIEEMFSTCEIFTDCEDINSILVVSDESEKYNHLLYFLEEAISEIKTDGCLIKEDPSFRTLFHFLEGREYLNSKWTDFLEQNKRIHIIYLAVDPSMQHHDIAAKLLNEVIDYANEHELMISLETHNEANVAFYRHFGFELFEVIEKRFELKQYCLVKNCNRKA